MKDDDPFKKIDKFGFQLLVAFFISISVIVVSNLAFAEIKWAQKPIQCATYEEVAKRIKEDNLLPLMNMTGTARIDDNLYVLPYVFYYNQDSTFWLLVEVHTDDTACIVGVGDTLSFDVEPVDPSTKREW